MTLAEQLALAGVELGQKVGFIVEFKSSDEGWIPTYARIGMVSIDVPVWAEGQEDITQYDPEYDLLVLWRAGETRKVYLFQFEEGNSLYLVEMGGMIIEKENSRISFGQNNDFMDVVCNVMCSLAEE